VHGHCPGPACMAGMTRMGVEAAGSRTQPLRRHPMINPKEEIADAINHSDDPVTAVPSDDDAAPVSAGGDPGPMDGAVGAHHGSDHAGEPTSQGAGRHPETNVSAGRESTHADVAGETTGDGHENSSAGTRIAGTADAVGSVADALGQDIVALLDLPRWAEHLRQSPTWRDGDRASSMLLRQPPVRVLLTALRSGADIGSDGAQETVLVLILSGAASVEWHGVTGSVGQGQVALVPAGGGWRIASEAPETVVLSVFWGTPGTAIADDTEH